MEFEDVKVDKSEGIGKISIDRPPVNIMRLETISEMISALKEFDEDPEIIVITITGKGEKAFSAGVEVEDHLGDKKPKMIEVFGYLFKTLSSIEKITIASVNGVALGGGCELVAGCDLAIASNRARFSQPEIKLATFPPAAAHANPNEHILGPHLYGLQVDLRNSDFHRWGDRREQDQRRRLRVRWRMDQFLKSFRELPSRGIPSGLSLTYPNLTRKAKENRRKTP